MLTVPKKYCGQIVKKPQRYAQLISPQFFTKKQPAQGNYKRKAFSRLK